MSKCEKCGTCIVDGVCHCTQKRILKNDKRLREQRRHAVASKMKKQRLEMEDIPTPSR